MSAPPSTILSVLPEEAEAIRGAVRAPDLAALGRGQVIAGPEHVAGLLALLSDPAVSDPIYDLPRPFTIESISQWVAEARRKQADGEAILTVALDDNGEIASYSYFTIWPERSAAELAGAIRADRQQSGNGRSGAARSFQWMFERLGVRLIGLTAALDNDRSARVIEAAGFVAKGVRDSVRPDGTIRQSRYWELLRDSA
ncbi:GNAT family N-acetyltransferase [uncultured Sphingomonas sp.]|uniref:GNAT family N-acetyltransferase n=1 Tax=uncultured Sphingomonas sp. TaxID=158754 RepID=UPI0026033F5D|nr:GNAT family N-acetyltransferase [uncultured Sphingomonas sp.]